jgi:hypothetical protein
MKILNFELRKIGTLSNLYDEVDKTLKRAGADKGNIPFKMIQTGVAYCLNRMFKNESTFHMYDLNKCFEAANVKISTEKEKLYRSFSGTNWGDMEQEVKNTLIAMILDDLRDILNPQEIEEIETLQID